MFESQEFHSFKKQVSSALTSVQGDKFQSNLIDFNSLFDSSLSVKENVDNALKQLSVSTVSSAKQVKAEMHKAELEANQAVLGDLTNNLKLVSSNNKNEFLKQCLVSKLPFVVVIGSHGWGKTSSTLSLLNEAKTDYCYLGGYSTPLALYNFLSDNQHKEAIIIDDLKFNNPIVVGILKQACARIEGVKTVVQYTSTSKAVVESVISDFKPSIVLVCNDIPRFNDAEMQSLIGRAVIVDVCYSFEEKKQILLDVSTGFKQESKYFAIALEKRLEIASFLIERLKTAKTEVSIRTLLQLFDFYLANASNWQTMAESLLELNKVQEVVVKLALTSLSVESQFKEFKALTGSSRATFFRIRRQLEV